MEQSKFEIWVKRCQDLHLSENCIKGLAFFLGLKLHRSENKDQQEIGRNLEYFLSKEEFQELYSNIPNDLAQTLFLRSLTYTKAFMNLSDIEFPENRINSDGKPTTLFDPYETQDIFEKDDGKLAAYHKRYENLFEGIGEGFSIAEMDAKYAFVYGDKFILQALLEDVQGYEFFDSVMGANGFLPPIFAMLLSKGWNEQNLVEDGYLPFQTALGGYVHGLDLELINFIWGCQRILFYDQETLKTINLDFQWGSTLDFVRLVNYYCENYFSHDNIKAHTAKHLHLFQSQKDIEFDSYIAPEGVNFYEFLLNRIKEIEGYDYRTEESLSDSNRLQFKANFFFKFMYGIAANPHLLVFKETSVNS